MKKIEAIIRPHKLPAVTLALYKLKGLADATITDTRGFWGHRPPKTEPDTVQDLVDYVPLVRIEIVCPEDMEFEVVLTIKQAASTGQAGDGKIYVSGVGRALRIATGERGEPVVSRQPAS